MENKTNNTNSIVSYRNKHILTIVFVVYIIVLQIFPIKGIFKLLVYVGYAFIIGMFTGTYEKKDELTQQTLAKATEITFYVLIALLFIGAIVIENITSESLAKTIAIDMYYYILFGAIALRSMLFLWLDRTPKEEDEEGEEE